MREIKRRDLSEPRGRLQKKDRHSFHVATRRLFGFEKDWDLVEDGKVIATCSDRRRLVKIDDEGLI